MHTITEAAELEVKLEEWVLLCRSGKEVPVKEYGERRGGGHAHILRRTG